MVLDRANRKLSDRSGSPVPLRYRSMSVLLVLAETPGENVDRQTIVDAVWPDTHVSEDSLAQCIADIRRALGDTERNIVETVPRLGYRLVPAPVQAVQRASRLLIGAAIAAGIAAICVVAYLAWPKDANRTAAVAVLPLEDLSAPEHAGYLSDALSEGIITELARFPQFKVIARNSSFQFRDSPTDIREIGDTLGADYVVEGSQQFDGEDIRITIQLIETERGTHVFARKFDRKLGELLAVQDEIVGHVAATIGGTVLAHLPDRQPDRDPGSILRGLQARKLMSQPTRAHWEKALALEETSIREDPASPWGYIGKSLMLLNGVFQGWISTPRGEILDEAAQLAGKAMELAPDNYMSHYAAARILAVQKNYAAALQHYERAAELNPSDSIVFIAMSLPLLFTGQTDRAMDMLQRAKSVDPLHGDWLSWQLGWAYWQKRECDKGLEAMRAMANPPAVSKTMLAALYVCAGETAKAKDVMAGFLKTRPGYSLADEIRLNPADWKPEGTRARWLAAMREAGMPES